MSKILPSAGLALLFSQTVFAHPGHDHSHWLSDPIHALTAAAIGAVIVTAVVLRKRSKTKTEQND